MGARMCIRGTVCASKRKKNICSRDIRSNTDVITVYTIVSLHISVRAHMNVHMYAVLVCKYVRSRVIGVRTPLCVRSEFESLHLKFRV